MKEFKLKNRKATLVLIAKELASSDVAAYHHRLHALLLVANGQSCKQVADLFGENTRTIQRWINRYEERGLHGLVNERRAGAKPVLTPQQMKAIEEHVSSNSATFKKGWRYRPWTGKLLSAYLEKTYGVAIGERNCQRLLNKMDLPEHSRRMH